MKQVTEKQIEKALKPSKLRKFFSENLTKRFKTADCNSCAIARYLQSEFKVSSKDVKVDGDYGVRVKGTDTYLPDWSIDFIERFDRENTTYVTGKKSLEILLDVAYRSA